MEGCYRLVDCFSTVIGEAFVACVPLEAIESSTTLDMRLPPLQSGSRPK
jgi:hypothetical protein